MSEALGVEVGRVWRAGAISLPEVATNLAIAGNDAGGPLSALTARTGGVGNDPGPLFEELQALVVKALSDSEQAISDCAVALIWAANDYELTDQAARDAFAREKNRAE